jgi:transposase
VALATPAARACLLRVDVRLRDCVQVSRFAALSDEEWARIEPFMPVVSEKGGRPFADHRTMVEAIVYRYRTGIPWRDLPREQYGPWQTAWKRHRRFAGDGTWDKVLGVLLAKADAAGLVDWAVSVDSTINRAHQHATNTKRPEHDTGGSGESQESCRSEQ